MFFTSPTQGKLVLGQVVIELVNFMDQDRAYSYKLVIGTDSKSKKLVKPTSLDFVTAVVIHRQGRGGRYFWQKRKVEKIATLRDKIYAETSLSLQVAETLVPLLKTAINGEQERYLLEIHIDVGPNGPTREMIKEVVGLVNGNGYRAQIKPVSFGASAVADRHT